MIILKIRMATNFSTTLIEMISLKESNDIIKKILKKRKIEKRRKNQRK